MSLPSISSSHRFAVNYSPTAPVFEPPAQPSTTTGDRRLLQLYTGAIRRAVQTHTGNETLSSIPGDSAFGAWWSFLFHATESPKFVNWARSKNIDTTKPIQIDHYADSLTVTINGERRVLEGAKQGLDWREVISPMMAAAKALGLYGSALPTDPTVARLIDVARFHGESLMPDRKEETLARAAQLERNQSFDVPGPTSYVNVEAQSPELLEQLKRELGDSINEHHVLEKLRAYIPSKQQSVDEYLATTLVTLDHYSTYVSDGNLPFASLENVITANKWYSPKSPDELKNLIAALAAPKLPLPRDGNFSGTLGWPIPMPIEDQAQLFRIVADNKPPLPVLNDASRLGTTDVLGALLKNVPRGIVNQGDFTAIMDYILDSRDSLLLGEALKLRMGEAAANATPREILLTAIAITLDAKSLEDPKEHHVAGFDLAAPEHYGQPLSVIKQRLIAHLKDAELSTPEAAPVAAMLLLSRVAPELLVPGRASVTYGSNVWFNLKAAVARIEATNPGASARMNFDQISAAGGIDPITDQERDTQKKTALSATIEWSRARGVLPLQGPYTNEQLEAAQQSIASQEQAMMDSVDAIAALPPTQREVALAELRAEFGPIDFEKKSVHKKKMVLNDERKLVTIAQGSYSMLDLYLSDKQGDFVWSSSDPAITVDMIKKLGSLPDPIEKHDAAFAAYARNLSKGWSSVTKNLIAKLPLEDRKNIEWGDLTVYQRGVSSRSDTLTPKGLITGVEQRSSTEQALIVKTVRNGSVTYYDFDPLNSAVRRRDDLKDSFKEGLQGPEVKTSLGISHTFTAPAIWRINPSAGDADKEKGVADRNEVPKSFSSDRSEYLGKVLSDRVIRGYSLASVKDFTQVVTTFDEEKISQQITRDIILGVIPGASAAYNLVAGNYKDAAADVIFDVVMLFTTAGLGKGLGAVKGGNVARRPLGKSLLENFRRPETPSVTTPRASGSQSIPPSAHFNQQELQAASRRADVVEGTVRGSDGVAAYTTLAKYDDAGKLVAFNPGTRRLFGRPLKNVQPAKITEKAMQANMTKNYKKNGSDKGVCYNTALRAGQGEKALSPRIYDQILDAGNHNGVRVKYEGYPVKWNEAMGISPDKIHKTVDLDSIKESGFINFHKRSTGDAGHTVYVQVSSDGKKVLYSSNSSTFDRAALSQSAEIKVVGESLVIKQDPGTASRIQGWMDKEGYDFSYSPSSEINARVSSWS